MGRLQVTADPIEETKVALSSVMSSEVKIQPPDTSTGNFGGQIPAGFVDDTAVARSKMDTKLLFSMKNLILAVFINLWQQLWHTRVQQTMQHSCQM